MIIYVSHSRGYVYKTNLYIPIRNYFKKSPHVFILPHEEDTPVDSQELFFSKKCDLVIAEVSFPSTGQGIELGWADACDIPIACIHKKGADISDSLQKVSAKFLSYISTEDMLRDIETILAAYSA